MRSSFHSLRRTATTLLHEAGVPSTVAQALIGHDSEEVHSDYITVDREALRNAVNSFPVVGRRSKDRIVGCEGSNARCQFRLHMESV